MPKSDIRREHHQAPRETVFSRMGRMLGMPMHSEAQAWRLSTQGVAVERYVMVAARLGLRADAIGPESTIRRRIKKAQYLKLESPSIAQTDMDIPALAYTHVKAPPPAAGELLTAAESERLVRLVRVFAEAAQLFDSEEAAIRWLHTPADYMNDGTEVEPMKLAESDSGARIVEALLQRTAHGIF